jgi:hypothetical protein
MGTMIWTTHKLSCWVTTLEFQNQWINHSYIYVYRYISVQDKVLTWAGCANAGQRISDIIICEIRIHAFAAVQAMLEKLKKSLFVPG